MSPEEFARRADVSCETLERLKVYAAMVERYQRAINLVSSNTLADIWRRHFLDSAQIFPELPSNHSRILDLGSGAGFPAWCSRSWACRMCIFVNRISENRSF